MNRDIEKFELDKQSNFKINTYIQDDENKENDKVRDIFFEKVMKKRIEKHE